VLGKLTPARSETALIAAATEYRFAIQGYHDRGTPYCLYGNTTSGTRTDHGEEGSGQFAPSGLVEQLLCRLHHL
jgi:hypothetical protein